MKKLSLYALLAACSLTLASCDEDFTDWAAPQTNAPENAISIPGITASGVAAIDLRDAEGDSTATFQLSTAALPEGFTLQNARIELNKEGETGVKPVVLNTSLNGLTDNAELQKEVEAAYGKAPKPRVFDAHVYLNAVRNGEAVLIDAGQIKVTVTPKAPFIASAYYLIGDVVGGWGAADIKQFAHSGADVYEDPVFKIVITTTADNQYWKIIPQTCIDAGDPWAIQNAPEGVVGVEIDGDDSMSGTLLTTTSAGKGANAGKIAKAGTYTITLNMMEYTYTIEQMLPKFYIFGDLGGWSAEAARKQMMMPGENNTFTFTTRFNGNIKIWGEDDLGNWDRCWNTASANDGSTAMTGTIEQSNGGAIHSPEAAYYTFTMDLSNMTYQWTKLANQTPTEYTSVSIIGIGDDWDNDIDLTQVAPHNWYGVTDVTGSGLKFRANHGWAMAWGGDATIDETHFSFIGNSAGGAPNIKVPAGKYAFYLNDITGEIKIVAQ